METVQLKCGSCGWLGPINMKEDEEPNELTCPSCSTKGLGYYE